MSVLSGGALGRVGRSLQPPQRDLDLTSVCPQMSSYKRQALEEEELSDNPGEAASSPDIVEVSERSTLEAQVRVPLLQPNLGGSE